MSHGVKILEPFHASLPHSCEVIAVTLFASRTVIRKRNSLRIFNVVFEISDNTVVLSAIVITLKDIRAIERPA